MDECSLICATALGLAAFPLTIAGGMVGALLALWRMGKKKEIPENGISIIGTLAMPPTPPSWAGGPFNNGAANWLYNLGFDVVWVNDDQVAVRAMWEDIRDAVKESKPNSA